MKIEAQRRETFVSVTITEGDTTMDLWLLHDEERDELAKDLIDATWVIGPAYDRELWFAGMLKQCGIDLSTKLGDATTRRTPSAGPARHSLGRLVRAVTEPATADKSLTLSGDSYRWMAAKAEELSNGQDSLRTIELQMLQIAEALDGSNNHNPQP